MRWVRDTVVVRAYSLFGVCIGDLTKDLRPRDSLMPIEGFLQHVSGVKLVRRVCMTACCAHYSINETVNSPHLSIC